MKCLVLLFFILSSALAFWGILAYEYDVCTITTFTCIKGWPETAKALSYGIITGWIISGLTVVLPHEADKQKYQDIIMSQLVSLNEEISCFVRTAGIEDENIEEVEYSGNTTLISAKSYSYILYQIPWFNTIQNTSVRYIDQAEILISKICKTISKITIEHRNF